MVPYRRSTGWKGIAVAVLLAGVTGTERGSPLSAEEPAAARQPAAATTAERLATWRRALEKRIDLELVDAPLSDVVELLTQLSGVPHRLDLKSLNDSGVAGDTTISFRAQQIPVRSVLPHALRRWELRGGLTPQGVVIRSDSDDRSQLETVVHDVSSLANPHTPRWDARQSELCTVIVHHIGAPAFNWEELGGSGQYDLTQDGLLVVTNTPGVHEQIVELLNAARHEIQRLADKKTWRPACVRRASEELPAAVAQRMQKVVTHEFVDAPLGDVVELLATQYELPLQLNEVALEASGQGRDTPVTWASRDLTLQELLEGLLNTLDLAWLYRDDMLLITSREDEREQRLTRIYAVADLVDGDDVDDVEARLTALQTLIQRHAGKSEPGWVDEGGQGAVDRLVNARSLIVTTSNSAHAEVSRLLDGLRSRLQPGQPLRITSRVAQLYGLSTSYPGAPEVAPEALLKLIRESLPEEKWTTPPRHLDKGLYLLELSPRAHRQLTSRLNQLGIPLQPLLSHMQGMGGGMGGFGMSR